ncbi:MAG: hypothetical protein GX341_00435 [Firmicutes bacterium]|nr:hypothetical protein [Bacillota bacterium]
MGNYICMRCGEETDEPHFDLVSGTVSCPICLEQDAGILSRLRSSSEHKDLDSSRG